MADSHGPTHAPALYDRLIDRLSLAVEAARTSVRLGEAWPAEVELQGLSYAEFHVLKAYLDRLPERHASPAAAMPPPDRGGKVVWLKDKPRGHVSHSGKRRLVR